MAGQADGYDVEEELEVYRTLANEELQVELRPAPGSRKRPREEGEGEQGVLALPEGSGSKALEPDGPPSDDDHGVQIVLADPGPRGGMMGYYLGKKWEGRAALQDGVAKKSGTPEAQRNVRDEDQAFDPSACPVTRIKENDIEDIKARGRYQWVNENPSSEERENYKRMLTEVFKGKYAELSARSAEGRSKLDTDQYDKEQKMGLQLKGAHQHMERPKNVELPDDYQEPMGVITLDELMRYSWQNPDRRYLISVYGMVFDVSDRPDKYGPDGPYTTLTGADITWGLFAGVDTEDYINKFYDLFKGKDMGKDKIAGVCSWLGWYWNEYGDPVAQLDILQRESELPPPPLEEMNDACAVM